MVNCSAKTNRKKHEIERTWDQWDREHVHLHHKAQDVENWFHDAKEKISHEFDEAKLEFERKEDARHAKRNYKTRHHREKVKRKKKHLEHKLRSLEKKRDRKKKKIDKKTDKVERKMSTVKYENVPALEEDTSVVKGDGGEAPTGLWNYHFGPGGTLRSKCQKSS